MRCRRFCGIVNKKRYNLNDHVANAREVDIKFIYLCNKLLSPVVVYGHLLCPWGSGGGPIFLHEVPFFWKLLQFSLLFGRKGVKRG